MRTRPAVAVTVLAALDGTAGLMVEAAFGIPAPTRLGVAQPQVSALAGLLPLAGMVLVIIPIFRGGGLRSELTRA
jgi:hypothetical protein